jgi:hypothetical protein
MASLLPRESSSRKTKLIIGGNVLPESAPFGSVLHRQLALQELNSRPETLRD